METHLSRERIFFSIHGCGNPFSRKRTKWTWKKRESTVGRLSWMRPTTKQSKETSKERLPATMDPPSDATAVEDLVSLRGMQRKDLIEFGKLPKSNSLVIRKMHFKSEICSSSSIPTEVTVRINEIWRHDTGESCPRSIFEYLFHSLTPHNFSSALSRSTCYFPTGLWWRMHMSLLKQHRHRFLSRQLWHSCAFSTFVVTSKHSVAQVPKWLKSVKLHLCMSILRLCIALVQQW